MKKQPIILKSCTTFLVLLLCLIFLSNTNNSYAQAPVSEADMLQEMSKNPYKVDIYKEVCDAFLYAKNNKFDKAKPIIEKIDKSKAYNIRSKFEEGSSYEIYRAMYNLSKGLILNAEGNKSESEKHIQAAITDYNSLSLQNMKRKNAAKFDFGETLNSSLAMLSRKKTPPRPPVPPPSNNNEKEEIAQKQNKKKTTGNVTPEEPIGEPLPVSPEPKSAEELAKELEAARLQKVKDARSRINDFMGKKERELKEALMREALADDKDNVDVTNCGDDMAPIDMRISFDYVEEGFAGDAVIEGLSVSSAALDATIQVISKTLDDFTGDTYKVPEDKIKAKVIGETDDTPFEEMAIVDGANWYIIPIKDNIDIVIDRKGKDAKRIRRNGIIMQDDELAATRAALAKQKLVQQTSILDKMDIETDYLTHQETGKVRVQITIRNAFDIYLDDLKKEGLGAMFLESEELSCLCQECNNCIAECTEEK